MKRLPLPVQPTAPHLGCATSSGPAPSLRGRSSDP